MARYFTQSPRRGCSTFTLNLHSLHVANAAWTEAVACYEQAYWLDPEQQYPRYQLVICHAGAAAWDSAVEISAELPGEVPEGVDSVAYHTAVAQGYHHVYQATQDAETKQRVIEACEAVLRLDKRAKDISKLLAAYQGKKTWWRR